MGTEPQGVNLKSRTYEFLTIPIQFDYVGTDFGTVKIPAGNFPKEFSGCEGFTLNQLAEIMQVLVNAEIAKLYAEKIKMTSNL